MSLEEEQKKKREAILLEIEETKKQCKHFIEVKYPFFRICNLKVLCCEFVIRF